MRDDDDPWAKPVPKGAASHAIGQDLSALSLDDLDERIALLGEEIRRLEAAAAAKRASAAAADAIFRKRS